VKAPGFGLVLGLILSTRFIAGRCSGSSLRAAPDGAVLPGRSGAAPRCCSWRCSIALPEMQPGPGLGRRGRCLLAPPFPLGFAGVSPRSCSLALLKPKPSARALFSAKKHAKTAALLLGLSWLARDGKPALNRRESAKRSQRRRPVWLALLWRCSRCCSWRCSSTLWQVRPGDFGHFGATLELLRRAVSLLTLGRRVALAPVVLPNSCPTAPEERGTRLLPSFRPWQVAKKKSQSAPAWGCSGSFGRRAGYLTTPRRFPLGMNRRAF
jgi:hypothetical protein